mmetsp:Transcript_1253/g.3437  ORF Transcript_1253/g.3437 Transcript_1253/m.3437 type:complete len:215 (-) Transcript_1253:100-744(-)
MAKRLDTMCLKTKLCKYYLAGHCSWEGHCCYAHGRHELQIAPDLSKTKFCPILARQGVCLQPRCGFAHSKEELRRAPLLSSQRREMRSRGTALGASSPPGQGAPFGCRSSGGVQCVPAAGGPCGDDGRSCNTKDGVFAAPPHDGEASEEEDDDFCDFSVLSVQVGAVERTEVSMSAVAPKGMNLHVKRTFIHATLAQPLASRLARRARSQPPVF